jgi:hypothetical protein
MIGRTASECKQSADDGKTYRHVIADFCIADARCRRATWKTSGIELPEF